MFFMLNGNFEKFPLRWRRRNAIRTRNGRSIYNDRYRDELTGQKIKREFCAFRIGQAVCFDLRRFIKNFGNQQRSLPCIWFRRGVGVDRVWRACGKRLNICNRCRISGSLPSCSRLACGLIAFWRRSFFRSATY